MLSSAPKFASTTSASTSLPSSVTSARTRSIAATTTTTASSVQIFLTGNLTSQATTGGHNGSDIQVPAGHLTKQAFDVQVNVIFFPYPPLSASMQLVSFVLSVHFTLSCELQCYVSPSPSPFGYELYTLPPISLCTSNCSNSRVISCRK